MHDFDQGKVPADNYFSYEIYRSRLILEWADFKYARLIPRIFF